MKAMETEFSICRLCLEPSDPSTMIVLDHHENLLKSILQITSVQINIEKNGRVYLCGKCRFTLDQCIKFRTTCIENDFIFRETYATGKIKIEDEFIEPVIEVAKLESESGESEYEQGDDDESDEDDQNSSSKDTGEPHKKPYKSRKDARKVQCQQCGKMIVYYNLGKHQQIHNPDRPKLTCPHCPKFYTDTRKLKLHINATHTHEVQYSCDRCGKVYGRPGSLREHYTAAHTDIKRHECKICGQKFARSALRRHHYKVAHTTARPWACDYCGKTFKLKSDWTVHTRIHTGEKPFKCDICHKTFNKSYNVVIHKKSHRNDKKDDVSKLVETQ